MGRTRKDDESDDIVILSIGKLYNGAWDKKYWSSSRGKDRYPYPVGYKSVRTQNEITYTMEILEGFKGPSFKISSTDGKSCSGDTPEIAWESFQKKGSLKSLHAKRFSCKIDGVKFFGFRNTFVQRLLRELAANVGGPAEQSSLPSKFSAGVCETNYQVQGKPSDADPDSRICLSIYHGKGKRSRKGQAVSCIGPNGTRSELLQQEEIKNNFGSLTSKQRNQSNSRSSDLPTFVAADEVLEIFFTPGSSGPEKCVHISGGGVKLNSLDIFDHLNEGESLCEGKRLPSSVNNVELNINNLHKQPESSGGSLCFEVYNNIIPENRNGATNVQHDIPVGSSDLCVADSLDHFEDNTSVYPQNKDVYEHLTEKDAIINNIDKSEILVADSLPEDEIVKGSYGANLEKYDTDSNGGEIVKASYSTNSEMWDNDSVGDDISKSMMAILLPQAVPLLKTFSRKKKKSTKYSNIQRSHENDGMASVSMNDSTTGRGLFEHSDLQSKNETACLPCTVRDSAVFTSGNLDSVLPDSFDNYCSQEMLHHADAAHSGQMSHGIYPPVQLPMNGDTEVNAQPCQRGSSEHDTRTADLTLLALQGAVTPPNEFTPNAKRARLDHCSTDNMIPTADLIQMGCATNSVDCDNASSYQRIPTTSCCNLTGNLKMNDGSMSNIQHKLNLNIKLNGHLGPSACFIHPMPISMVQLIVKENEIFTCVKCGYSEQNDNILFVYKASKKENKMGCPSLVGYVPIALEISKNTLGTDIASERSLLQLTPDGGSLVLLNSIKIPHCREGKLHCLCSACASDNFEKNTVKIVKLNRGHASLITILKTAQGISCFLVCEPSFLLAAEEGGQLKLWVMNSGWSGQKEEWYLPTLDCMFSCLVELKVAPNSAVLVIGHNGLGEFGIWDIDKRNLVSRFSSTGMSVSECIPINIFRWQSRGDYNKTEALVAEIMDATEMWYSLRSENLVFSPEDKDVAAWLLISTTPDLDQESYQSREDEEANAGRYWRLALLVDNIVITGSIVDEGSAAAAGGHGIMGRRDGQVYMWELSTGKKLRSLQTFKGSRVSCVTTDTSNSGALAIAGEDQLLIYLPS